MQPVPSEPHFQTLRLYFDGCEAMAAYQRGDRRWRTFTAPDLILDRALKCRRLALTEGFIDFSDDQLNALETWPISDPQHALWRDEFVTMSSRGDDDNDLYGQRLPAQLYDLLYTIEDTPPYGRQGNNGVTKKIRIGRTMYFAKLAEEYTVDPLPGQDERDAAACAAALHALQPGIATDTVWHVLAANGQHCLIAPAVPGRFYRDLQKAAPRVDEMTLQWIVLAEWLFGMGDRHSGNLIISQTLRTAAMIDLAPCWRMQPMFLGYSTLDGQTVCYSWARELWSQHDPSLTFSQGLLFAATRREAMVLDALQPFPLDPTMVTNVRRQFAILRSVNGQDIGLADLEQKAQTWYTGEQGG